MRVHDRFIALNGLRLRYREWGDPAARPLLLLHGGSAHAHWWDLFAPSMADRYHVLALDLRGHGDSQHAVPPRYRMSDYADDVTAFCAALGLHRFDLIGHSLGAMIAVAFGGRFPQCLNSLTVVDSQLSVSPAGARYMTRLRNFPQTFYRDHAAAIHRFRLLPTATAATPEILAHVAAHGLRAVPDGRWTLKFDRESLAQTEPQDLLPVLQRLTCPILLVRGAHSTLMPRDKLAALLAAVPHARATEIPGAHHHVMLDNPAAFEHTLREFLLTTLEPANR